MIPLMIHRQLCITIASTGSPKNADIVEGKELDTSKLELCRDHTHFMNSLTEDYSWRDGVKLKERLAQYPVAGIYDMALSISMHEFARRVEEGTTPDIALDFLNSCSFFTPVSDILKPLPSWSLWKVITDTAKLRITPPKKESSPSQSYSSSTRNMGTSRVTQRKICCASAVSAQHDS